jgi:hypothetical protein
MFLEPLCTPPSHVVQHKTPTIETSYGVIGRRSPAPRLKRLTQYFEKWYNHMPAEKVRNRLGSEKFDSYLKISTIRDPYDYAISFFHEYMSLRKVKISDDVQIRRAEFVKFINGRWTNQLHLLTIGNEIVVQRFVRLEHFHQDLENIVTEVGAQAEQLTLPFVKINKKRSRNLTDYYDKPTAKIVRSHMNWVFDRFDYPTKIIGI